MNAKKLPIATSLLIVIHAACAQAESSGIPEKCFASGYQNYQAALKAGTADEDEEDSNAAWKLKPITVRVKDSQPSSGARVTLDASETTVPSGEPGFIWFNDGTGIMEGPVKTRAGGSPGSYFNYSLTVVDKVCGHMVSNKYTVYNK